MLRQKSTTQQLPCRSRWEDSEGDAAVAQQLLASLLRNASQNPSTSSSMLSALLWRVLTHQHSLQPWGTLQEQIIQAR